MRIRNSFEICATFEAATWKDNYIYFSDCVGNRIFRYDIRKQEVELFYVIDAEPEDIERAFLDLVIVENTLFCIPFFASSIYAIDTVSLEIETISLELPREMAKFVMAHVYKENLYIMPASAPYCIKLDTTTKTIEKRDEWIKDTCKISTHNEDAFFRQTMQNDEIIFAPCCQGNAVVMWDLEQDEFSVDRVGGENCRFSGICFDGINYWLSPRFSGPLVKWNRQDGSFEEFFSFPCFYENKMSTGIRYWNDSILIFPKNNDKILVYDLHTKKMKLFENADKISVLGIWENEGILYYMDERCGELVCLSENKIICDKLVLNYSESDADIFQRLFSPISKDVGKGEMKKGIPYIETFNGALEKFVDGVILLR